MAPPGLLCQWMLLAKLLLGLVTLGVAQKVIMVSNLTCWVCTVGQHGENCLTMNETSLLPQQTCPVDRKYCKVKRRFTNDVVDAFERDCAAECKHGCITAGNSNRYVIGECTTCCNSTLCNVGTGGAVGHRVATPALVGIFVAAVVLKSAGS
ncbi:PREDICTED: prostate stem cell antigen-like [Priapulus caudatus]|uniref:Prostate stem cell antigen-like n=1 Tax=Priapulus caudatus TaxID=37621 RepID=A0ABM1F6C7_PRICU|nr:PREDICTED: prostate stem cell antigen-like [Priapulus caudatus]